MHRGRKEKVSCTLGSSLLAAIALMILFSTVMQFHHCMAPVAASVKGGEARASTSPPKATLDSKHVSIPNEKPYVATIQEKVLAHDYANRTMRESLSDLIHTQPGCFPDTRCNNCLRLVKGSSCGKCRNACPCLCRELPVLCIREDMSHIRIAVELTVTPPPLQERRIPRVVHQLALDHETLKRNPDATRFQNTFRASSWDYRLYTPREAAAFLEQYFPRAVSQAFEALKAPEHKNDLFGYCVLLIHGGIFADYTVVLGSSLDLSIPADVGFMAPFDDPGRSFNKGHCLWNGFIAAAPGHVFLAEAVETAVNQIRNKFDVWDITQSLCPQPELSILHSYQPRLFLTGSCLLGASVNRVLGRHWETQFQAGDLAWRGDNPFFFGRTVILRQRLNDMGAHRFSLPDSDRILGSTQFLKRRLLPPPNTTTLPLLYTNTEPAWEKIEITVGRRGQ